MIAFHLNPREKQEDYINLFFEIGDNKKHKFTYEIDSMRDEF